MKITFFEQLKARLTSASPAFMLDLRKKYVRLTQFMGTAFVYLMANPDSLKPYIPEKYIFWFQVGTGFLALVGAKGLFFDTKVAVANPEELQQKLQEIVIKKLEKKAAQTAPNQDNSKPPTV